MSSVTSEVPSRCRHVHTLNGQRQARHIASVSTRLSKLMEIRSTANALVLRRTASQDVCQVCSRLDGRSWPMSHNRVGASPRGTIGIRAAIFEGRFGTSTNH